MAKIDIRIKEEIKDKPVKEKELAVDLQDRLDQVNSLPNRIEIILIQILRELQRLK